ncbi:MAG TPA: hypothetical protein VFG50_17820, partial [Rhodothermales bacterium]|nr:hypothetical protein [Rhodothermales bacterium]
RTRLLVAPTARPLKAGQGYFADYEIFLPFVAVGVTDRISIGGGISIVPGDIEQLLYLTPKVTVFTTKHVGAAVGVLYGTTTRFEGDGGGLVYGIGTFGSPVHALTAGVGFAFGNGGLYKRPVFLLGGESQVANSIKLISENYFVLGFEGDVVVSGAVRFFGDRLAADLGLVTSFEAAKHIRGWPFAPLVSFAYNFGRN